MMRLRPLWDCEILYTADILAAELRCVTTLNYFGIVHFQCV